MNGDEFNRLYGEVQEIRKGQEAIVKLISDISTPIAKLQVMVEAHDKTLGKHSAKINSMNDWLNAVKGAVAVISGLFCATIVAAILGNLL